MAEATATAEPVRPVLFKYFRDTAKILLTNYERSKGQAASANLGHNREVFCNDFLHKVLPPRLQVRHGEVWDSVGNRTGQLDTVILRDDAPAIEFGGAETFLSEGVFAVVEVKSNLTRDKLQEAISTLKKVAALQLQHHDRYDDGPIDRAKHFRIGPTVGLRHSGLQLSILTEACDVLQPSSRRRHHGRSCSPG